MSLIEYYNDPSSYFFTILFIGLVLGIIMTWKIIIFGCRDCNNGGRFNGRDLPCPKCQPDPYNLGG